MICHLKFTFAWILFLLQPIDGATVTWYEPTPVQTTSNPAEALIPGKLAVYEGSPATLNWNYSHSLTLTTIKLRFKGVFIVNVLPTGQVGPVNASFRQRFSVNSTPQRLSLLISKVITGDDKSNGEFSCELNDLPGATWKRAIQLQVVVPLKIIEISGKTTVLEGSNLNLTCTTLGQPEPNITWTKEKPGNQGNTVVVQEGKVLNITDINRTHAGNHTCTANHGFGTPKSQTVYVNVTYPAKIVNFSTEYLAGVGQSVTLYCEAEGNPPSNYTWTPCNKFVKGQVCDKKTLVISQVCEDSNYTCKVVNGLGSDSKTANVFIGGKSINITIKIADGKYNESSLLDGFDKEFQKVFTGHGYEKVEVRGDSIVELALQFNTPTTQTYVVTRLRNAVKDGRLGKFAVHSAYINGTSCDATPTTPTPTPTPTGSPKRLKKGIIIAIAIVASLFLVIIVGNLCCWYFSTTICIVVVFGFIRKCLCKKNPDSKVHSNGGKDAGMEAGYSSPDNQYAAAGPKANYRASNPSSEPSVTYEVAYRGSEGRRGNRAGGPREQLPEYAVVDKTKKKKKGPKPGELQYAELDQLTGRGQKATMPRVSGTDTVYADIKS
ncbi:uncharacterized protein [Pocillopora verrucosa]|uniref:uncharacterized protein isoform X2 n=1 Tax=Pocillopora verrucosa TaxID=203993 RepID=UPI00333E82B8